MRFWKKKGMNLTKIMKQNVIRTLDKFSYCQANYVNLHNLAMTRSDTSTCKNEYINIKKKSYHVLHEVRIMAECFHDDFVLSV